MRFPLKIFCFITIGMTTVVSNASFLRPASFPKTSDDLSFTDQIELKKDAYDQLESTYDSNGNCIAGCAYAQPKWEDELAARERWNKLSRQELIEQHHYTLNPDGTLTPPPVSPNQPSIPSSSPTLPYPTQPNQPTRPPLSSGQSPSSPTGTSNANCEEKNSNFENRDIPYKSPLGRIVCITSPFGPRNLYDRKFHYGIDFRATVGTPVYSPANGIVKTIFVNNKSCGNGIIIEHSSGYSTQYCHLDKVMVKKGDRVSAGCLIGKSGNTGQSTGPHLHYAVKKDGNPIDPMDFLEAGHKRCD